MLTYETIRKILDEEKTSKNLAKIPADFFKQAKEYLDKKAQVSKDWEFESAERRLKDVIDLREKKVIMLAMYAARANTEVQNLTEEERELFNTVLNAIKLFRENIEKQMSTKKEEPVVILNDIVEFVGINMNVYGPFKIGDVVTLPKPNAELLVKKEYAKRMNIHA